jgi:hypothetical protein
MGLVGPDKTTFVYKQEVPGSKPCMCMWHYVTIWPWCKTLKMGIASFQQHQQHKYCKNSSPKEFFDMGTKQSISSIIFCPSTFPISLQTQFLQFVWISSNKIHSKINIFHTLALKIVKKTPLILTHQGLSNTPKIPIHFPVLIWFNCHWEKWFNNR